MRFNIGDKVIIHQIPLGAGGNVKYGDLITGLCGMVRYVYSNNNYGVKIDNRYNHYSSKGLYYFNSSELRLSKEYEQNNIYNKGEENMNKIIGNYRVAKVRFLEGSNTYHTYNYALFDDEIQLYDNCVVKSANHGFGIASIEEIIDNIDDISVTDSNGNIREIVCKIDMSAFHKRIKDRQRVSQLKKEMDKKVKELQGLALYKMMAETSPELKTMLSEYEELTNNG